MYGTVAAYSVGLVKFMSALSVRLEGEVSRIWRSVILGRNLESHLPLLPFLPSEGGGGAMAVEKKVCFSYSISMYVTHPMSIKHGRRSVYV